MKRLIILLVTILVLSCGDKRSQEPRGSLPYNSKEVSFQSLEGDVTLSGTLTTPKKDTLKTAVVLIGGSGPGDRDYRNQFGHRPFLVLSHYLTNRGITVLRYDERGVGKSRGNYREATYENLVSDVAGGIDYLRGNGFQKVGLIGHSEGGGMAPAASLKTKTDFLILMAPPNAKAHDILVYQTGQRLRDMGVNTHTSEEIIATVDSLLSILETEPNVATARTKMERLIAYKEKHGSPESIQVAQRLGDAHRLIEGWLDPKFIYALHHDPLETLKEVNVPILVLYGKEDGATDVTKLLPAIKLALASRDHQVRIFPGLGHLFMNTKGAPIEKLHEVEETISPDVLDTIGEWILLKAR